MEPAQKLHPAAGVFKPGQGFALVGLLRGDLGRTEERSVHKVHVHGHPAGVHGHVIPPLLLDLLRHRPVGKAAVIGPFGDDVHAVVPFK